MDTASPEPAGTADLVAPELRPLLDIFPKLDFTGTGLTQIREPLPGQREFAAASLTADQKSVGCESIFIQGPVGAPDVRILLYTPPGTAAARPALLHMHGGGFVLGMPEINDGANRSIALAHGCIVASVDYRLAPETIYPGAVEDCYAALAWLHQRATALGVDPARVAIAGESAGAGHAATLALLARDRGQYPICFQLLDSPALDDRTGSATSIAHPVCGEFVWTPAHNRFGWQSLLGTEPGSPAVPPGAVPARHINLTCLPPCFIAIGALDLFLEESLEYARRLVRARVSTELHVIPGAFHGFGFAGAALPQSRALLHYRNEALARAFAHTDPA